MAVSVPGRNAALTPSTARWPPKRMLRSRVSNTAMLIGEEPPLPGSGQRRSLEGPHLAGMLPARHPRGRKLRAAWRWPSALRAHRQRHFVGRDGANELQDVVVLGVFLDAEVIHVLERLVILLAEGHRSFGRVEREALHGGNQLLAVAGAGLLQRRHHGRGRGKPTGDEEVWRCSVAFLILGLQPIVLRILGEVVIIYDSV